MKILQKAAMVAKLVVLAGACGGAETSFTFTNRAGEVLTNARVFKIEGEIATVIAGTVGRKVNVSELPEEVQRQFAGPPPKSYPNVRISSFKGRKNFWVGYRGKAPGGDVFVSMNVFPSAAGSAFEAHVLAHLDEFAQVKAFFTLARTNGSVHCKGYVTDPKLEACDEGRCWTVFLSAEITRDEMIGLVAAPFLDLIIETADGRLGTFAIVPDKPVDGFMELCQDAKPRKL